MKTAEEIADEVFDPRRDCFDRIDLVYLVNDLRHEYGAQVREEAARIAENLPCLEGNSYGCHTASAAAIRKMELP